MKAGDVIGVLLNTADNSLSFFLHGEHDCCIAEAKEFVVLLCR